VLDTGLDLNHPDFAGRNIQSKSFVANETVDDRQGHGTHTAGTIAGPKISNMGRRYGVAPGVELFVGKVLDNGGSGRELDILEGINWAIDSKCVIISMSLGRAVSAGEKPDPIYEEVGAAALREGSLIIAAAGNESGRDFGFIAPVGAPANSPSIMAVAAVDPTLKVAPFSCGGINPDGGEVNVSGPGVSIYSSFPRPQLSRILQGTSMACPHASGIAALWAESDPSMRGEKLWKALERSARELGSSRDFGRGLVVTPNSGVGA
jgi:subtilisin